MHLLPFIRYISGSSSRKGDNPVVDEGNFTRHGAARSAQSLAKEARVRINYEIAS